MEIQKGFKQTEVGVISDDWDVDRFENVTKVITCGLAATPKYVNSANGKPFLSAQNVQNGKVVYDKYKHISKTLFEQITKHNKPSKGDLLYTRVGAGIGEAGVVESDLEFAIYVSLTLIKVDEEKLNNYFLLHLLNSSKYKFFAKSGQFSGAGVQNLNVQVVRDFIIPLPTKAEQTAIATALNDADALITQLGKLIAKKQAIKQGAMQELLKPKEGWELKKLEDFIDYEQPTKYLVSDTEYNDHNQTPVLTAGKTFILGYTNEEFGIFNNLPVIIFDDFTTASKYVDFQFKAKSSAMKILKPKKDVNLKFVFELIQTIKFDSKDHKRYWISEYQNIEVKVPKQDEQTRIAQIISDMDTEIEALEKKLDKHKMIKQGMMQNLLTGRIRLV